MNIMESNMLQIHKAVLSSTLLLIVRITNLFIDLDKCTITKPDGKQFTSW